MASGKYQCGRWLSPDPLGGDIANPQSLNRYAYVLNNPTTLTDPSGMGPQQTFCIPGYEGTYEPNIQTNNCGPVNNPQVGPGAVTIDSNGDPLSADLAEGEAKYASNFGWQAQGTLYGHSYNQFFSSLDAYFDWRTSLAALPESQCYQSAMVVAGNQGVSSVSGTCQSGTAGLTYTFVLKGSTATANQAAIAAAGGWPDPVSSLLHPAESWYLGGLFGAFFGTSHLIDSSAALNLSAHIDPFGPLNPLHYLIQLPLGSITGPRQPITCSAVGGCTFGP